MVACTAICAGVVLLALRGCANGPQQQASTSPFGGVAPDNGQVVTPQSGAQNGFATTDTTPSSAAPTSTTSTPESATPNPVTHQLPNFTPDSHPPAQGGSTSDNLTASYHNNSTTPAYDVYIQMKLDSGQWARFDLNSGVQCDTQSTYTPTFDEKTAIYCPQVPGGQEFDLPSAIWDNPSNGPKAHARVYISANHGVGANGNPPPGSPKVLLETVDILGQ
jgi:hypothetical protein